MIKVNKDYDDIPRILLSKNIRKEIENIASTGILKHKNFVGRKEIEDKLKVIYSNKCAYCESKLDTFNIDHYRPKNKYYWIAYEWSNLLPSCPKCSNAKADNFPIINEKKRIVKPQTAKDEWIANSNSFMEEGALILNPEIDNPEEHLSYFPDGRIEGLTQKGEITIKTLKLNRESLIQKRSSLIEMFQNYFEQKLEYANELLSEEKSLDTKKAETILKLAFEHTFLELALRTNSDKEFALLGRIMFKNFHTFFIDNLENKQDALILNKALSIFKSELTLKESVTDYDLLTERKTEKKVASKIITIKQLQISNIKCYNNVLIDFENRNTILLGINGRGKTTILQLLALGLTNTHKPLFESEWKNVRKDNKKQANFEITIQIDGNDFLLNFKIDKDDNVIYDNPLSEKINELKNTYKKVNFEDIFLVAYGTGRNAEQHNYPLNNNFKPIATLFGINNLMTVSGEVSEFLNQRNAFNQIKKIITKIFKNAENIQNKVELKRYDKNNSTFYFTTPTNTSVDIPLNSMSAGFRTSFQWILDLVIKMWKNGYDLERPEQISGIVLIDEIDTHLHIKWQRTILYMLQKVFPKIQFIVTTHSPFVVQSLEYENIVALQLIDNSNEVSVKQIKDVSGSSYESIINELFDEDSLFSIDIEKLFDIFYKKRDMILKEEITRDDDEFKRKISELKEKGEEVANIVNRELRQIDFLIQQK